MKPTTKNPKFAVNVNGVFDYNPEMHSRWFWWPYEQRISKKEAPLIPELGQCVYGISYGASRRFKMLKEKGWHNGGPDHEKKCFVFFKKTEHGNSPFRIAVKYSGDMIVWISGVTGVDRNGNANDDKLDMVLNMIEMVL